MKKFISICSLDNDVCLHNLFKMYFLFFFCFEKCWISSVENITDLFVISIFQKIQTNGAWTDSK